MKTPSAIRLEKQLSGGEIGLLLFMCDLRSQVVHVCVRLQFPGDVVDGSLWEMGVEYALPIGQFLHQATLT